MRSCPHCNFQPLDERAERCPRCGEHFAELRAAAPSPRRTVEEPLVPSAATDSTSWIGKELAGGRYRVTGQLGQGGMGTVYRAWDQNTEREVVIKVPRRSMLQDDPGFGKRFQREIRSLVNLSHPHIVKVFDAGEHDGLPFAVMQFLAGGSLEDGRPKDAAGQSRPVAVAQLGGWLEVAAGALDFVHAEGYVHRDVKPSNILFEHQHVYLSDFGLAKALAGHERGDQSGLTRAGLVVGTPEYMAPEIILGQPYDGRVDQYALAVVVYERLAGQLPFEGSTPAAVLVKQATAAVPDLHAACPAVPAAVAAVVARALAKAPAERFPSCVAFARAVLEPAASGHRPPPLPRAQRPPTKDRSERNTVREPLPPRHPPLPSTVVAIPPAQEIAEAKRSAPRRPADGTKSGEKLVARSDEEAAAKGKLDATPPSPHGSAKGQHPPRPAKPSLLTAPFDEATARRAQLEWAKWLGEPATIIKSINMKLVLIAPGEFLMGSPDSDSKAYSKEKPQHRVQITQPFYLGVYQVTQSEYENVMGTNPSCFKESGPGAPVDRVSWEDAQEFCRKLSSRPEEQAAGRRYRLPTEAEWEYACRAGNTTRYGFDESKESLDDYAWYHENSGGKTHPVGQKKANAWGLYDMQGNVWEWCADWYGPYSSGAVTDPEGAGPSAFRVLRGGGWDDDAGYCQSALRDWYSPGSRDFYLGFRLAAVRSGR